MPNVPKITLPTGRILCIQEKINANEKIVPVNFEDPQLDHYAVPRTIIYRWNLKSVLQALKEHAKNPF